MSRGDLTIFVTRPISGTIIGILALFLIGVPVWNFITRRKKRSR